MGRRMDLLQLLDRDLSEGICTNFGNCTKADDPDRLKHTIQIPDGAELVCPQCGAPLTRRGKGPVNVLVPMLLIFAPLSAEWVPAPSIYSSRNPAQLRPW